MRLSSDSSLDCIPPEVLKRCNLDDIILEFCNQTLLHGKKPEQWSILNIVPIPKAGDLSQGGNYRGISLSSIVAKTFNRMILNRIRPEIDKHLRDNQNGFRVGRTTVGHILALRRLIEGIKSNNLPAIITFIDFKKAFDTIHRGKMIKILKAYGNYFFRPFYVQYRLRYCTHPLAFPRSGDAASASRFRSRECTTFGAFPQAGTGTEIITNLRLRGFNILVA